ncbi:piggyBac transposable element-derived protein 4 [Trichonephila clavipes]|uniref:PiggyBac transposable element-derived protein 4 n=1 Tax=Trichonephila clavipes TaxID=2585209 RepID=A0A8X6VXP6_TRICX|nr:piggyBac transposable element-derived protein 4 [Trichonephila clavipes]
MLQTDESNYQNAFVLYQKQGGKLSHLNFRLGIIDRLIERHGVVNEKKGRPEPLPLTEENFLEGTPPTDKKLRPTRSHYVCLQDANRSDSRANANEMLHNAPDTPITGRAI